MRTLNLGILAHVDAGKTTLTERLLYSAGVIDEIGRVDDGTTQTDSLALERQRGITIKSAVVSFSIDDVKVNLIDTPGHPDFIAEVERVLNVLDGAVLVISAVEGVQPQTLILMRVLRRLRIPTLIFVNKIDRPGARYEGVLQEIATRLTPAIVPMGTLLDPGTRDAEFVSYGIGDARHSAELAEMLAENDEAVLSAYVDDDALSLSRLEEALATQTRSSLIHPVYFGTAFLGAGVEALKSGIVEMLPTVEGDADGPVARTVFKVERGLKGEKIAYVRMFSGAIENRDVVKFGADCEQKVTAITVFESGLDVQRSSVVAGEIGKLWGLTEVRIGDALGAWGASREDHQLARPTLETAIVPRVSDDKRALHEALSQLAEQDPLINLRQDDTRQELYLSLSGEVQKEVIEQTLADEYGVEVEFRETTTICIERPIGIGSAIEALGKEPNPFKATIGLRIEPAEVNSGISFKFELDPTSIPIFIYKSAQAFQSAMESTTREVLQQGLNGWQVTDCMVVMTDSGYLAPVSHARDFRHLTPMVLMSALKQAGTVVCEPVHLFHIEGPEEMLGPTLRELARLGAVPRTTTTPGSSYSVEGEILATRMHQLQLQLRGLTRGEGLVDFTFDHYRPVIGASPSRPRTDNNPLDYKEYLLRVVRRV